MGEAKRRQAEIAELKKTPLERKRVKHALGKAKTEQVYHFKNEAARREVDLHLIDAPLNNSEAVTRAVKLGQVEPRLVQQVDLKIFTPVEIEPSRQPRQPQPLPLAVGAKGEDLAHLAIAFAQINPRGFRQPSAKEKNWQSTSLVEKLSIAFLGSKPNEFKRSERGEKKLKARRETNALIMLDRLIERYPDRAAQAKHDEQMLNWFVAKLEGAYSGDEADQWREWLRDEAKRRLDGRDQKYLHSKARMDLDAAEAA